MKTVILTAALIVIAWQPALAGSEQLAQKLLAQAEQQAGLLQDPVSPFQLDLDFTVQLIVPTQGRLRLKQEARDRWWRKLIMGTYEEIDIRNGEMQYTLSNQDVMPLRIVDLFRLLQFADGGEDLSAKRLKKTAENGMALSCIETNSTNPTKEQQRVCVAPESGEISNIDWREFPDEVFKEQFSDYAEFGGHRYPRDLRFYENGSKVVSAQVRNLSTIAFDETLLNPPRGAIERRKCANMRVPLAVKMPMPIYPKSAHQNRMAGNVIVSAVVLTDGTVGDARIVGQATHDMDAAVQAVAEHWKFRPAMCGLDPVVTDIQVTVTFRMN